MCQWFQLNNQILATINLGGRREKVEIYLLNGPGDAVVAEDELSDEELAALETEDHPAEAGEPEPGDPVEGEGTPLEPEHG